MKDIDKGYKNLMNYFKQLKKSAEIGIFENKKDGDGQSIAEYAASNEFGATIKSEKAKNWLAWQMRLVGIPVSIIKKDIVIPERSFMRSSYDENLNAVMESLRKNVAKDCINNGNFPSLLLKHGELVRNNMINKIRSAKEWATGLSDFTKAKKGNDTILIESGNMWKAIDVRLK